MRNVDWLTLLNCLLVSLLAFIAPIQWLIIGVGVLICFDTIAGIYASYKTEGLDSITSKRFGHIVSKFILYNIGIISGYVMQLMIGIDVLPLAKLIAVAVGLTELKSIAEKIHKVTKIDIMKFIYSYLKRGNDELAKTVGEQMEKDSENKEG